MPGVEALSGGSPEWRASSGQAHVTSGYDPEEDLGALVADIVDGARVIRRTGFIYRVLGKDSHDVVVPPQEGEVADGEN